MARHFAEQHFSNHDLLSYDILEQVLPSPRGGNRVLMLRRLECHYILNLDTMGAFGFNAEEELKINLGD